MYCLVPSFVGLIPRSHCLIEGSSSTYEATTADFASFSNVVFSFSFESVSTWSTLFLIVEAKRDKLMMLIVLTSFRKWGNVVACLCTQAA